MTDEKKDKVSCNKFYVKILEKEDVVIVVHIDFFQNKQYIFNMAYNIY